MAAVLAQPSIQTMFDAVGRFIPGAKVYYYLAGTTTPLNVYTTAALSVLHARPVLANAAGRFPPIYVGEVTYKARILDASGSLLEEIDGIQGAVPAPVDPGEIVPGTVIPVASIRPSFNTEPETGWVRANARTIGSGASGATELADETAEDLFLALWNAIPMLVVSGGRGVTAAADWAANKTLTLPSLRGRGLRGLDGMGSSLAGVITTATYADANLLGAVGGSEMVNLTIDNIDEFTLTATTANAGLHDHTPGGTTSSGGNHSHTHDDTSSPNTAIPVIGSGAPITVIVPPEVTTVKTTSPSGTHSHDVTLTDDGEHNHTVTIAPAGGGDAHNNMPPDMLVTFYIKL